MRITSEIPSVSHPGYVHPPGTEVTLSLHPGGHYRVMELTVPPGVAGEEGWTEKFVLPRGMKVDPTKPLILGSALVAPPTASPRAAHFVVDAEKRIVGVGIAMDDGRFEVFELGAGFVDAKGAPV